MGDSFVCAFVVYWNLFIMLVWLAGGCYYLYWCLSVSVDVWGFVCWWFCIDVYLAAFVLVFGWRSLSV